jgi:hypothetical protein
MNVSQQMEMLENFQVDSSMFSDAFKYPSHGQNSNADRSEH